MKNNKVTILIIDDNPENLDIISEFLNLKNYTQLFALNGKKGIEIAGNIHPNLILLDVTMPGLNGYETCKLLKADETTKNIPVIFMTARTDIKDKVRGFQSGAVDYITKPIQAEEMFARIKTHVSISQLQTELQDKNNQLKESNEELKDTVIKLKNTLLQLAETHKKLIEVEKQAIAGILVNGMSHELNTPLGIGITASSSLLSSTQDIIDKLDSSTLKESEIRNYLEKTLETTHLTYNAFEQSSELIKYLKQINVKNAAMHPATFEIKKFLKERVLNIIPENRQKLYTLQIMDDKHTTITCAPDLLLQIFANLIQNSIEHGYDEGQEGTLSIDIQKNNKGLIFIYTDDGKGIAEENKIKVFEPFFTTARSQKKKGLGLFFIYQIITHLLKGKISFEHKLASGVKFIIEIPQVKNS